MTPRNRWLAILGVTVGLLVLGHAYQRVMEVREARTYPPPGERFDVGTHALHLDCRGEGTPTVVLDAGIGSFSADWVRVRSELEGTTRTCSYDRAGYGWSEAGPPPRDLEQQSTELRTLLERAGEEGPFLLVGHSLGGAVAWRYAQEEASDVTGVVLVDAPDRAELERGAEGSRARLRAQRAFHGTLHALAATGALRGLAAVLGDAIAPDTIRHLSGRDRDAYRSRLLRRSPYRTAGQELVATPAAAEQLEGAGALGELPLVVVTATDSGIDGWEARQASLLELSTRSEQVLAASSHYVHLERPEVVVAAVDRLLAR